MLSPPLKRGGFRIEQACGETVRVADRVSDAQRGPEACAWPFLCRKLRGPVTSKLQRC